MTLGATVRRRRGALLWLLALIALTACTEDLQLSSQGADIGGSCQRDGECLSRMCYIGRLAGYCSSPCETEGSPCARDAVCKPVQGGAKQCLVLCGATSTCGRDMCPPEFCPAGSLCVSTSSGGARVCEPSP